MSADRRVIACNYVEATSAVPAGSRAYVSTAFLGGNLPDRVFVVVRSRSGRWINKWESLKRLTNFRLTTLPPEHPRYREHWLQTNASPEHLGRLGRPVDGSPTRCGPLDAEGAVDG